MYFLDCASLLRSNSHGFAGDVVRVNIDHHQDNPGFGELNLVDAAAPSTSAILYEVFKAGGFPIDAEVATALYVGLVTDTGRFQYSNTTPALTAWRRSLQEAGVRRQLRSTGRCTRARPLPKLLLLERALVHLEVRLGGALVVSWLGNDDFAQAGADEGHAEGIIDTLRQSRGSGWRLWCGREVREGRGGDQGEPAVDRRRGGCGGVWRTKRGGGGHVRAAGFTSADDVPRSGVLAWIESQVAGRACEGLGGAMRDRGSTSRVVLVDKPVGPTSFDMVRVARRGVRGRGRSRRHAGPVRERPAAGR